MTMTMVSLPPRLAQHADFKWAQRLATGTGTAYAKRHGGLRRTTTIMNKSRGIIYAAAAHFSPSLLTCPFFSISPSSHRTSSSPYVKAGNTILNNPVIPIIPPISLAP